MKFFEGWMKRWQERNAHAVGYRFGDAPTADEVAPQAVWTIQYEPQSPDCGLTVAQHARLAELIEECGEVVQAAAKVLQCGYDERSRHGKGMPRRVLLERELGHLEASLSVLYGSGDARRSQVRVWEERRLGVRHASPAAAPTSQQESDASQ